MRGRFRILYDEGFNPKAPWTVVWIGRHRGQRVRYGGEPVDGWIVGHGITRDDAVALIEQRHRLRNLLLERAGRRLLALWCPERWDDEDLIEQIRGETEGRSAEWIAAYIAGARQALRATDERIERIAATDEPETMAQAWDRLHAEGRLDTSEFDAALARRTLGESEGK